MSDTTERAREYAERALRDLKEQTGDDRSAYYTQGLTNWIPDLVADVLALAAELAAAEKRNEELVAAIDVALEEGFVDGNLVSFPADSWARIVIAASAAASEGKP